MFRYFNYLNKHAVNESTLRGQHNFNTLHDFGDFDLTLFPQSNFRVNSATPTIRPMGLERIHFGFEATSFRLVLQ